MALFNFEQLMGALQQAQQMQSQGGMPAGQGMAPMGQQMSLMKMPTATGALSGYANGGALTEGLPRYAAGGSADWGLPLLMAGLGIMGGDSPNAMTNIGRGASAGLMQGLKYQSDTEDSKAKREYYEGETAFNKAKARKTVQEVEGRASWDDLLKSRVEKILQDRDATGRLDEDIRSNPGAYIRRFGSKD